MRNKGEMDWLAGSSLTGSVERWFAREEGREMCCSCGEALRGVPWARAEAMARAAPHTLCCGALAALEVVCPACSSSAGCEPEFLYDY